MTLQKKIHHYSHILLFCFILLCFAPISILFSNYEILLFSFNSFFVFLTISFFLLIFFFILFYYLNKKLNLEFLNVINIYLIFILIVGTPNLIIQLPYYLLVIIELLVFFFSIIFFIKFKDILKKFISAMLVVLILSFIIDSYFVYKNSSQIFQKKFINVEEPVVKKDVNNVYHMVLDAFQFHTLNKLIKNGEVKMPPELKVYEKFYTEFHATTPSMGAVLKSDNFNKIEYNNSNLHENLFKNGYKLNIYSKNEAYSKFSVIHRNTYDVKALDEFNLNYINTINLLIDYTFLKVSPFIIKKYLRRFIFDPKKGLYGFSITKYIYKKSKLSNSLVSTKPTVVDWPYWSSLLFKKMIDDEYKRQKKNNYIFCHLIIPHGPFVLDKEGNFNTEKNEKINLMKQYEEQAIYSIKMLNDFFEILKKLDRYENSTIIIHSDHGYFFSKTDVYRDSFTYPVSNATYGPIKYDEIENLDEYLESWARGTLIIKESKNKPLNLDINDFFQIRSVVSIIESIFNLEEFTNVKNIYHYISNDEDNITDYFQLMLDKKKLQWVEIKKIPADILASKGYNIFDN